jgi:hypothetical protein
MPGFQKANEANVGIYVRGGGADQNLFLLDNIPLYNVNHLFGFMSVFNPNAISNVDVLKGGFPARYSGRLSSVIDIAMKDADSKKFHATFNIGLISSSATLEIPIIKDKGSFLISARRTYIDLLAKPIINITKNTTSFNLYFYDFNAKFSYRINNKNRLYVGTYLGKDALGLSFNESITKDDFLISSTSKINLDWGNKVYYTRWNKLFDNGIFMNTTASYTTYNYNVALTSIYELDSLSKQIDYQKNSTKITSGIFDYALRTNFDWTFNDHNYIKYGIALTNHHFRPGTSFQENTKMSDTQNSSIGARNIYANEISLYAEDEITIGSKLKANMGINNTSFLVNSKTYNSLQPRFSASFLLNKNNSIRIAYSRMVQYLHLLTNNSIGVSNDLWIPVTENLKPQTANQYSISYLKSISEIALLTIETYFKQMDDVVEYKDGYSTIVNSNNWEQNIETGKGWSYGTEFLLTKKVGKFTGWIGYTLSWAYRKFENKNLGEKYPYKYDRRNDIGITINYKFSEKFDMSANWLHSTGSRFTLPSQEYAVVQNQNKYHLPIPDFVIFDGVGSGYNGPQKINYYSSINNQKMRAYNRLDLSFNWHKLKKHGERIWALSFYNAYNRQNPFFYFIANDQSNGRTKLYQQSLFPIMPSINYIFKIH